ncbi:hypothetical protein NQT66_01585 [Cellulophaga baltica]|uniref:hypothetical protein n=1 Tax=Cellulophaga baltica TaxID=76594 RepID=UPI00214956ED|nr:hypothetical protein [Cellulophaga baltica]MCR1023481.1 hypothetical protein [Cellulophaga baltica]
MGFNLSGIAINKNFEADFDYLQEKLGWNLEKQSEIDFETASSNWQEEGICDVYFSEQGTLLFISMDRCTESFSIENQNVLTFALSETSMAFNIIYTENCIEKRSIMQVEDHRMHDEGEKLAVESTSEDPSEIIWNQMGVVLGKPFWDVAPDAKATRYIFSISKPQLKKEAKSTKSEITVPKDGKITYESESDQGSIKTKKQAPNPIKTPATEKKWWEFWK